jgi:CRP-like cAMP-binding protein
MEARELKDQASELFRKGRFGKAAEAYLALSKAEPKEPQHLIKLGDSYRRDGKKEQAVDAYRGAVDAYAKQSVMIKAIAACKLILEIDPNQKEAQEALAKLCAKRYVKRTDVPAGVGGGSFSLKRGVPEAIDLPEESGSELEIEGRPPPEKEKKQPPPTAPPPPRGGPPSVAPPAVASPSSRPGPASKAPTEKKEHSVHNLPELARHVPRKGDPEPIEFDAGPTSVPPILKPNTLPPNRYAAASEPEPEPQEIDLDMDMGPPSAPKQPPLRGGAPPSASASLDPEMPPLELSEPIDIGMEPVESDEVLEELPTDAIIDEPEFIEELPADLLMVADNADEQEVLTSAASAAKRPSTAVARILASATRDDEEEVFAVTTGTADAPHAEITAEQPVPEMPSLEAYLDIPVSQEETTSSQPVLSPVVITPPEDGPDPREATDIAVAAIHPVEVDQGHVPLFSELPRDAFVALLESITFRRVESGEVILTEGDIGKSIFVLASGRAHVVKGFGTDNPIDLASLEEGAFFGEMALLNGSPRVASVIATEESEILEITEQILRDLTAQHPSVGQSLKKFYRQRLLQNVMAISPLFKAFDKPDRRSLVEKFKVREVKTNEAIISEGQAADGLYVVMHGVVLVQKKDPNSDRQVPLAALKEGDVFGEMSLLTKKKASATVVAKRRTLVLRLPKAVWDELMFTHPAVLEVVSDLSDQRSKVNEAILAGTVKSPGEALAFL